MNIMYQEIFIIIGIVSMLVSIFFFAMIPVSIFYAKWVNQNRKSNSKEH